MVLPDAVDLDLFKRPNHVIPQFNTKYINIVYAGHLYDYKGIPTILEAAKLLPDYQFHLIGGLPDDISRQHDRVISNNLLNVHIYGHFQQKEVPKFLHSADVLLLTHTLNHPAANFTSPVKLAEYLASEVPVVASDIPALRDWLKDDEVIFTIPDNPESLAKGIKRAVELSEVDKRVMIQNSLKLATEWSYLNRCKSILES
jgi:glycosyltransferase involved in cell wall biosynthesis